LPRSKQTNHTSELIGVSCQPSDRTACLLMPVHACEQSPNSRQLMLPEEQNRSPFRNEINCNASQQYDAITLARMKIKSRHHHIAVLVLENGAFVACSTSATVKRTRASVSSMRARWTAGASSPGASKTFGTLKGKRPQRSRRVLCYLRGWKHDKDLCLHPARSVWGPWSLCFEWAGMAGSLQFLTDPLVVYWWWFVLVYIGPPVVCTPWRLFLADDFSWWSGKWQKLLPYYKFMSSINSNNLLSIL
jgi:hypothetical protein